MTIKFVRPWPGATRSLDLFRFNYADFGFCRGLALRLGPVIIAGYIR